MTYDRNNPDPEPIKAKVILPSGEPITSGVVAYHIADTVRKVGEGSLVHIASGLWQYTPTQSETNYDEFAIEFHHDDAIAGGSIVQVFPEYQSDSSSGTTTAPSATHQRISARLGAVVELDVDFYNSGVLTDPFAIRRIEIYKSSVAPHNLVETINVVDPSDSTYPSPVERYYSGDDPIAGRYYLPYNVPIDLEVPDVYFDVWYYFTDDPCGALGTDATDCDIDDEYYDALLQKCCHRFWIYPDDWICSDKLQTIRFSFEPLDQRFHQPEVRPLEVGIMPLPLYDYNFNLVNRLIPYLRPTISIETRNCELLVSDDACRIGIRHGSYRSNPWVIQYDLDTSDFLKGTYQYSVKLTLPDGSSRVSRKFVFTIL